MTTRTGRRTGTASGVVTRDLPDNQTAPAG